MAGFDFDYRTKPEAADELTFYIFDNLRMQQDGEGGNVHRFDTIQEALIGFRMIQAQHPNWTIALGGSVGGDREIDFVHRRQGRMNVLLDDCKRIPFWVEREDVAQAVREFAEGLGIDRQVDREILNVPVLIPYAPEGEPEDPYLADKALLPKNPANALSSIAECYVEGEGWISFDQLTQMARESESGIDGRPVVTRINVAYETTGKDGGERGRTGYVDIAPHELHGMADRFRELADIREQQHESGLTVEDEVVPYAPDDGFPETNAGRPFFDYATSYGETERVNLTMGTYAENENLYVGLDFYDKDIGGMDFYGDVTVNIIKLPPFVATIDTNNNNAEKIMAFLTQNGFGEPTGGALPSGYCMYPVFRFDPEKLAQADPRGFAEHCQVAGIKLPQQEAAKSSLDDLKKQARERAHDRNLERSDKQHSKNREMEL